MTIVEFLNARLDEDEAKAKACIEDRDGIDGFTSSAHLVASLPPHANAHVMRWAPIQVLREVEAKRRIIAFHQQWPVLVESPPEFDMEHSGDPSSIAMRVSKRISWTTEQMYRTTFGTEPPTAPMLRALAEVYSDHTDYDDTWRP